MNKNTTPQIYISIYTNIFVKSKIVFMTKSFLFYTQNNSFHDIVIYLVQKRKVLELTLYFPFPTTNSDTY